MKNLGDGLQAIGIAIAIVGATYSLSQCQMNRENLETKEKLACMQTQGCMITAMDKVKK